MMCDTANLYHIGPDTVLVHTVGPHQNYKFKGTHLDDSNFIGVLPVGGTVGCALYNNSSPVVIGTDMLYQLLSDDAKRDTMLAKELTPIIEQLRNGNTKSHNA